MMDGRRNHYYAYEMRGGLHVVIGEGVAPSGKEDDVIEGRGLRYSKV